MATDFLAAGVAPRRAFFPTGFFVRVLGSVRRKPARAIFSVSILLAVATFGYFARSHIRFHDHLAEAHRAADEGRTGAAMRHLESCGRIDPDDRDFLLLSARVFRMLQAWSHAEEILERYWVLHGDDDAFAFERLLLKAASEATDSVAPLLTKTIAQGGGRASLASHALASGYLREFRYTDASAILEAWRAESQGAPLADFLLGSLEEQRYNIQRARELFGGIVDRHPDHHEARLRFVVLLMQMRDAGEALGHLAVLRAGMPESSEVELQWAMALRQVGRTDEANAALDTVLTRSPNSPVALTERATTAINAADDQTAADLLAKALRSDPGALNTRNLYILALTRLGRLGEASSEQARVKALSDDINRMTDLINGPLQMRPNDPTPAWEIGGIALRSGQPPAAINWYQLALKRDPKHVPSHTALAVIYHEMGNPVSAAHHRALASNTGVTR